MTTFITSDIHLNHRNILTYCPHRGGPEVTDENVARMNETIITNWNATVGVNDEVYVLGDVAMGKIELAPALIKRLNGTKYLVRGNHDKSLTKRANGRSFADDLFVWVKDYHEMFYPHNGKKVMICMSHFPISHWNGMNSGALMCHGHLHGSPSGLSGRITDVGIDTNNLFPYTMDAIVEKLMAIEVVRDHH